MPQQSPKSETGATAIRPLKEVDLTEARRIFHLAFGTFLGLPDPMQFCPDRDYIRTRFLTDRQGALAAVVNGELAGSNFAMHWGSVGVFGPLTVRPDLWEKGVAKRLLESTMELFAQRGHQHTGLFTFSHSAKHIGLYQKFGYWPRYLTAIMAKELSGPSQERDWNLFSETPSAERRACLQAVRELTDSVFEGLDLEGEIMSVEAHRLGDTILIWQGSKLNGVATCHTGPETEAGNGTCYIKFGLVKSGPGSAESFLRLLGACESYASRQGLSRMEAGVNLARQEAYGRMRAHGFKTEIQGVAMHRPNESAYNRPGIYLIDDWR